MFRASNGHLQDEMIKIVIIFRNSVGDIPGLSTDPECLHVSEQEILPSSKESLSLLNACYGRSGNEFFWFIIFMFFLHIYGIRVELRNIKYIFCDCR
jgi:hypothetical protein